MFGLGKKTQDVSSETGMLAAAFKGLPVPVMVNCVLPERSGLTYANDSFVQNLGARSLSDLIGRDVSTFFAEEQPGGRNVKDHVKRVEDIVSREGKWTGATNFKRGDGSLFEVLFDVSVVVHDGVPYTVAVMQDLKSAEADVQRREAMKALADDFEKSVGGIVNLVSSAATEMQASATQLTSTAEQTAHQSQAVSSAAEETDANVTSVAGAAEELGASVSEISRQVEASAQISNSAVQEATDAVKVMGELNVVAGSIGSVLDMISSLASQTNLLALNATIESARAGEAGKGFAVVASEVKALAGQTSRATAEIGEKISQIQQTTARAVSAIEGITRTISEISNSNNQIAMTVEQQSAATHEIVQAVAQASAGASDVTANINGVAQSAEQTGAAANQVLSASSELSMQAEKLHAEMNRFLANVRAA
ncbi:methyl-accepting chemotaxis protein [Asticcacaulis sp.]|uniref:methyl-accepting chemotaxis protein n=1 Tax=Asticcacaulis sp. TaxID=1872648 RepID=UPI0039E61FF2